MMQQWSRILKASQDVDRRVARHRDPHRMAFARAARKTSPAQAQKSPLKDRERKTRLRPRIEVSSTTGCAGST
jgi:hypothetical protein